jgi:hypothetical protein
MDWTRILACVTGTVDRELLAGWTDFFIAEVLTLRVLVTCYMLFLVHLESRRVDIAGITVHPNEACTCSLR